MRYFAQLNTDGTAVACVFPWDVPDADPVYSPEFRQPIEVTSLDPMPEAGWTYDPDTQTFSAPE